MVKASEVHVQVHVWYMIGICLTNIYLTSNANVQRAERGRRYMLS